MLYQMSGNIIVNELFGLEYVCGDSVQPGPKYFCAELIYK